MPAAPVVDGGSAQTARSPADVPPGRSHHLDEPAQAGLIAVAAVYDRPQGAGAGGWGTEAPLEPAGGRAGADPARPRPQSRKRRSALRWAIFSRSAGLTGMESRKARPRWLGLKG